jgi:glucose-6-phosphate isomerase
MSNIQLNTKFLKSFFPESLLEKNLKKSIEAKNLLHSKKGQGNDFLGWVDLPSQIQNSDLEKINEIASQIKSNSEYLVVVGIGGSYLGARAVIEANVNSFHNLNQNTKGVKIIYAGHHIDSEYHSELLDFLKDKEFSVNVISKSGTTTEPALAFRSLLNLVEQKYGKSKFKERIFATTDSKKGALKKLADDFGLTSFVIPDDVGGRYSVLTPVGLLPIASAGISIQELVNGAKEMQIFLKNEADPQKNLATLYASIRNSLYQSGKKVEVLVNYSPKLQYFIEWWKQLYGESEGKGLKGIFPAGVNFTTDLHSMGQYIQEGERHIFETVLTVLSPRIDLTINPMEGDPDGLNYISGKTISYVNSKAAEGTFLAHYEGGVPCLGIELKKLNPSVLGELIYFFEYACGVSGYMLGVNPFDQPGVEDYKNNMFALLGKKGFESMKVEVEKKLSQL